ncbi:MULTISPECIES: head GIN domain-containing protein [Bacteroidota]|jgi:hypothetical protein|uniref:Head GIN domain-containing protein n=2 Tax=Flectobacillus TaxID=101 RepID=A0ABT6Z674_9BACT|nr:MULTISPECIES: head GIN domain-containing protein [Bacteroidota]MDI9865897.1 head GIN domain-containing protein [Flectobacillus longus]MDI9876636.1 head GIN domain-containing protein [Flectobacillus rivi]MDI9878646.1 head GIN domain-containing protein [Flectobacillus longus]NBB28237.1 DUF2807 domain-containing protein [Cellulophaga sp. BC115SP]
MKLQTYFRQAIMAGALFLGANLAQAQSQKDFNLSGFNEIEMSSAFVIDVTQGSTFKVHADAERSEDLEDLEVKVSGKRLIARYKDKGSWGWNKNRKRVHFTIVVPDIKVLDFSGATKSKISGFNDLEYLKVQFSGASSSEISVNVDKLLFDISGASNVTLRGKGSIMKLDASGASKFNALDFVAKDADLDVSGATSVRVNASKTLNVEASGASSVRYRGTPSVRSDASGASSVRSE